MSRLQILFTDVSDWINFRISQITSKFQIRKQGLNLKTSRRETYVELSLLLFELTLSSRKKGEKKKSKRRYLHMYLPVSDFMISFRIQTRSRSSILNSTVRSPQKSWYENERFVDVLVAGEEPELVEQFRLIKKNNQTPVREEPGSSKGAFDYPKRTCDWACSEDRVNSGRIN